LLFQFGTAALRTLDLAFVVFRYGESEGELLFATLAQVFVVGHGNLRAKSSDDLSRAAAADAMSVSLEWSLSAEESRA
jgi:hypothetical protein